MNSENYSVLILTSPSSASVPEPKWNNIYQTETGNYNYNFNINNPLDSLKEFNTGDIIALYSQGKLVGASDTYSFVNKLEEKIKPIAKVADEVITSLRQTLDYNGYYIAYLLEQLSEEEFEKISEQFARDLASGMTEELLDKVRILFYLSSQSYTPSDLSDIFKIDEMTANKVINNLMELKLIDSKDI